MSLIAGASFAKPCTFKTHSCLVLKNQHAQFAKIDCNWLEGVSASANSQASTQLDLGYGDGLGSPEPRTLSCQLTLGELNRNFNFNNPYWGPVIEFDLISEKELEVQVIDGWSSQRKSYIFKW